MIVKNYFGTAFHFVPSQVLTKTWEPQYNQHMNFTTFNNTIYLMDGTIPDANDLYNIVSKEEFETLFANSIVNKIDGLQYNYFYDVLKKERIIKSEGDARDLSYGKNASIGWIATVLTERNENANKVSNTGTKVEVEIALYDNTVRYQAFNLLLSDDSYCHTIQTQDEIPFTFTFENPTRLSHVIIRKHVGSVAHLKSATVQVSNDKINWTTVGILENSIGGYETIQLRDNIDKNTAYKFARVNAKSANGYYIVLHNIDFYMDYEDIIVYSDSIGVWEDIDKVVVLESLNGEAGTPNIFKDFTMTLRDTCNLEIASTTATEFVDNVAGVLIINDIGDNVVSNIEKSQNLTITGSTLGIEDGQTITIALNNAFYHTNVLSSIWSVTIPANDIVKLDYNKTYTINGETRDRAGNLSTNTKNIFVKALNTAPIITSVATVDTNKNTEVLIQITFSDDDNDISTINVSATNGLVTINESKDTLTYIPNTDFIGTDTINISAKDGLNAESLKNITVTVVDTI